jgi:uncharacterized protein (DUF2249 family)
MRTPIVLGLCLALTLSATAQQASLAPIALSKRAEKVKTAIGKLSPGGKLSVIPTHGPEEYGALLSSTDNAFTFHDVDTNADVLFRFEDVRKVREGYGGYNNFAHKHVDRTRSRIAIACVLGGVAVVLGVALALDKS